jgi:hypothetical protein
VTLKIDLTPDGSKEGGERLRLFVDGKLVGGGN